MKRHRRASLVAVAVFSLVASPLAAQSAREGSPPAEVKRDGAQATQVLTTEAAARLGVSRSEAKTELTAPAMQQSQTMKWIIILGVAVLAAVLIMAVAN